MQSQLQTFPMNLSFFFQHASNVDWSAMYINVAMRTLLSSLTPKPGSCVILCKYLAALSSSNARLQPPNRTEQQQSTRMQGFCWTVQSTTARPCNLSAIGNSRSRYCPPPSAKSASETGDRCVCPCLCPPVVGVPVRQAFGPKSSGPLLQSKSASRLKCQAQQCRARWV